MPERATDFEGIEVINQYQRNLWRNCFMAERCDRCKQFFESDAEHIVRLHGRLFSRFWTGFAVAWGVAIIVGVAVSLSQ